MNNLQVISEIAFTFSNPAFLADACHGDGIEKPIPLKNSIIMVQIFFFIFTLPSLPVRDLTIDQTASLDVSVINLLSSTSSNLPLLLPS